MTRVAKTNTSLNVVSQWWDDVKFYLAVGLISGICIALGFTAGAIHTKKHFDQAAINSGHAQYHPSKGTIEWRICK